MDLLDGYVHIAKVRVASSNLVIRSREVREERPVRAFLRVGGHGCDCEVVERWRHKRDESFQCVASWEVDSVGHEHGLERLLGRLLGVETRGRVYGCRGIDHDVGDSEVLFGFGQPSERLCW
jgi:hypothetical protein